MRSRIPETALATLGSLLAAHRSGAATPEDTVIATFARIRAHADPAVFITLADEAKLRAAARALHGRTELPLYGIPIAVKDNIDVAGLPTTAACPAFAYMPKEDSTAVARLRAAGALIIGKTNLDQFATGLVGVRSPYGVPRNALRPELVPGGSSSGSAVAVAAGLVPAALGTDTAGSGRVPAMLNNIVGLKPSLGLVSTHGVVPACRTLDCVSVFALTVDDTWAVLAAMAGHDAKDPYSRALPVGAVGPPRALRFGVPRAADRIFFDDARAEADYAAALARLARLGATLVEVDMAPFYETARLLYEGPWVAERYLAAKTLIDSSPEALHPVTREIIAGGAKPSAAEAFAAFYRLQELRAVSARAFGEIDALALPTAPTSYTVAQLEADPIRLNSRLGTYTNFVNLLDLCGLAVPAALNADRTAFGITLLAPAGQDAQLAAIGRAFHADTGLTLGALDDAQPPLAPVRADDGDEIALAVVGAHLSGMPLNGELKAHGARFRAATRTAPDYRLYALAGTRPPKPGLLRVGAGAGAAIEVEIWTLPPDGFGRFVASVPPPLSIGTLALAGGDAAKGFLVEAEAVKSAEDISGFGGWRAYMAQAKVLAS
jgi:allophanate hydrolase